MTASSMDKLKRYFVLVLLHQTRPDPMLRKIFPLICFSFILVSCKKESVSYKTAAVTDYYPLQVGTHVDYDLDSTLFINFGTKDTVVHWQARDIIDAQITDNLGNPSYRVIRYIRKDETQNWQPTETYMVTPFYDRIETVENNLRYIKLFSPIVQDFSWNGNKYIDTYSTDNDLNYLDGWDYIYDSVGLPLTLNSLSFDSTVKVFQRDEFLGQDPAIPGTQYAEKNFAYEKYAKGVGLIYKEFLHWEYQGAQPGRPAYYEGYGIKLTINNFN